MSNRRSAPQAEPEFAQIITRRLGLTGKLVGDLLHGQAKAQVRER